MPPSRSAKSGSESVDRIEPAFLDDPPPAVQDAVAELAAQSAALGRTLHPQTAASLADLVRIMNAYYSNLIEGHNTRPRDIERALRGDFDTDEARRDLQLEAAAHVRVQASIDRSADPAIEPASGAYRQWLHREFYRDAPASALRVRPSDPDYRMTPGDWRRSRSDDVVGGRHQPPSSPRVESFMRYFEERYRFSSLGKASRILSMATAHHRLNYIHPFPDGNGRVSRLMSHAMAHAAGIGAHGLWSVSRGLARGLRDRSEYLTMMDLADTPRENDFDGRGNLSRRALADFVLWFLRVCLDQVQFMTEMFDLGTLPSRLRTLVERDEKLRPESARLLEEALIRGEFERGEAARILSLPERSARRVLNETVTAGLLASATPKGPVSLRFTPDTAEVIFPRLF